MIDLCLILGGQPLILGGCVCDCFGQTGGDDFVGTAVFTFSPYTLLDSELPPRPALGLYSHLKEILGNGVRTASQTHYQQS